MGVKVIIGRQHRSYAALGPAAGAAAVITGRAYQRNAPVLGQVQCQRQTGNAAANNQDVGVRCTDMSRAVSRVHGPLLSAKNNHGRDTLHKGTEKPKGDYYSVKSTIIAISDSVEHNEGRRY